jgi:hypothetical protein
MRSGGVTIVTESDSCEKKMMKRNKRELKGKTRLS